MITGLELRRVGLVPVRVVAVAVDHQVHVHVPQAGQHAHAFGGDHLGAGRHRERARPADGGDALALDEDDAVADRAAAEAVDERAADERLDSSSAPAVAGLQVWVRGERDGDGDEQGGGGVAHAREYTRLCASRYGEAGSNVLRFALHSADLVTTGRCTLAAITLER